MKFLILHTTQLNPQSPSTLRKNTDQYMTCKTKVALSEISYNLMSNFIRKKLVAYRSRESLITSMQHDDM